MDDSTRTNIILAAISSTPPVTEPLRNKNGDAISTVDELWKNNVATRAADIAVMIGERSPVAGLLDLVAAAGDKDSDKAKIIPGTVLGVSIEQTSTRGVVRLKTKVHAEYAPDGTETVRTERTDTVSGLVMARRMRELTGHRVLLRVAMEQIGGGSKKVRTLVHVEDLGLDENTEG